MCSITQFLPFDVLQRLLIDAGRLEEDTINSNFVKTHSRSSSGINRYNPNAKILRSVCKLWKYVIDLPSSRNSRYCAASLQYYIPVHDDGSQEEEDEEYFEKALKRFHSRVQESYADLLIHIKVKIPNLRLSRIVTPHALLKMHNRLTSVIAFLTSYQDKIFYMGFLFDPTLEEYAMDIIPAMIENALSLDHLEIDTSKDKCSSDDSRIEENLIQPVLYPVLAETDTMILPRPIMCLPSLNILKIASGRTLLPLRTMESYYRSVAELRLNLPPSTISYSELQMTLGSCPKLFKLGLVIRGDMLESPALHDPSGFQMKIVPHLETLSLEFRTSLPIPTVLDMFSDISLAKLELVLTETVQELITIRPFRSLTTRELSITSYTGTPITPLLMLLTSPQEIEIVTFELHCKEDGAQNQILPRLRGFRPSELNITLNSYATFCRVLRVMNLDRLTSLDVTLVELDLKKATTQWTSLELWWMGKLRLRKLESLTARGYNELLLNHFLDGHDFPALRSFHLDYSHFWKIPGWIATKCTWKVPFRNVKTLGVQWHLRTMKLITPLLGWNAFPNLRTLILHDIDYRELPVFFQLLTRDTFIKGTFRGSTPPIPKLQVLKLNVHGQYGCWRNLDFLEARLVELEKICSGQLPICLKKRRRAGCEELRELVLIAVDLNKEFTFYRKEGETDFETRDRSWFDFKSIMRRLKW